MPKTEVGGMLKLNRGERPPTGQSEEALWFRCRFRRLFQLPATKVPFSEAGHRGGDFRFPATKVPFSEVGFRRGEREALIGDKAQAEELTGHLRGYERVHLDGVR